MEDSRDLQGSGPVPGARPTPATRPEGDSALIWGRGEREHVGRGTPGISFGTKNSAVFVSCEVGGSGRFPSLQPQR